MAAREVLGAGAVPGEEGDDGGEEARREDVLNGDVCIPAKLRAPEVRGESRLMVGKGLLLLASSAHVCAIRSSGELPPRGMPMGLHRRVQDIAENRIEDVAAAANVAGATVEPSIASCRGSYRKGRCIREESLDNCAWQAQKSNSACFFRHPNQIRLT